MNHLDNTTLNLYLDDALDAEMRAHADAHLASCDSCQRELAALRALVPTFDAWREEPIPRDVSRIVVARIATRPVPAVSRWGAVVLSAQILFAVLMFMWALPLFVRVSSGVPLDSFPAWSWNPWAELGTLPNDFALPFPVLGMWTWTLVLVGVVAIWLVCNRLILTTLKSKQEARQ